MNKELENKIRQLAEKCKQSNENPAAIVLFALLGAYTGRVEVKFSIKVQEYVRDVLIPEMQERIDNVEAQKN